MKVSIITATYNSAQTIKDTLASLEVQTYPDIEYIVIDGASKDHTLEVIKQYSTKANQVISESDKGIYDALNKGISAATGDIIGFLHSDDLLAYPDAISDIVAQFKASDCQAVYGDLEYVSKTDTSKVIRLWKSGFYKKQKLQLGWMPPHPTFYMKRELYEQYGCFELNFRISADYDSLLRYLWRHNISLAYIPKVIIKMRVGGASNRSISNIIKKTKEDIVAIRKNGLFWPTVVLFKNLSKIPQFLIRLPFMVL